VSCPGSTELGDEGCVAMVMCKNRNNKSLSSAMIKPKLQVPPTLLQLETLWYKCDFVKETGYKDRLNVGYSITSNNLNNLLTCTPLYTSRKNSL